MINLSNVDLSYAKENVLENVALSVEKGEHIAIMGKSGCGKTTLVKAIAGLIKIRSGELTVDTSNIAYVFQEARLIPWLTALENVMFVMEKSEENLRKAKSLLNDLELSEDYDKLPNELSGGMQQRVSIARALAFNAELLILDEPLSALDEVLKEKIIALIKKHSENAALIVITHDMDDAKALSDKVYYIENKHLKLYA